MNSQITNRTSLKVLQKGGKRIAIRLEDIYWDELKEQASEDEMSLTKYVHSLVSTLDPKLNKTSFLRCYCLKRVKSSYLELKSTPPFGFDLASIINASPSPVFILGNDRNILAYNSSFKDEFLSVDLSAEDASSRPPLKLVFSQPFNTIKKFLIENPGRAVTAQVGFNQDNVNKQNWVRFTLVDKSRGEESLVIAFVENK